MKWFKYGCFGCLGIVGLILVISAAVTGLAWQRSRTMEAEERTLTRDLPAAAEISETPALSPEAIAADLPGSAGRFAGAARGRVILDLSFADFRIEPGSPGEPLRVEANFDPDYYELREEYEEAEDAGWTCRVSFRRTARFSLLQTLSELFSGSSPEVRILLPSDHPLALQLSLSQGGATADLGGLWLTSAEIDFARGGLDLRVSEPLRAPVERMSIRGRMGGGAISLLGNASPRHLEVEQSMGGLSLDLRGRWVQDSEISIDLSMGGGAVRLPRDVIVRGLESVASGPAEEETGLPILTFSASSQMGELEFFH